MAIRQVSIFTIHSYLSNISAVWKVFLFNQKKERKKNVHINSIFGRYFQQMKIYVWLEVVELSNARMVLSSKVFNNNNKREKNAFWGAHTHTHFVSKHGFMRWQQKRYFFVRFRLRLQKGHNTLHKLSVIVEMNQFIHAYKNVHNLKNSCFPSHLRISPKPKTY